MMPPTENDIVDALIAEELLLKMSRGNGWQNAVRVNETVIYALKALQSCGKENEDAAKSGEGK